MSVEPAVLNAAADGATAIMGWASLHSAAPVAGSNELAGGSPAYARQQVSWVAATGAVAAISGTETFNVPAGATVAYVGLFSAVTGGTFRGSAALTLPEDYAGQGTYVLTALTVTAAND